MTDCLRLQIPQYEQVQLCAYMWLLQGEMTTCGTLLQSPVAVDTRACTHVENYDAMQITTDFPFDEALWEACERETKAFIDTLLEGPTASKAAAQRTPAPGTGGDAASAALPNSPSKQEAYRLFAESGLSVEEVATEKSVQPATVIGYLLDAETSGLPVDLQRLPQPSPACAAAVRAAVAAVAVEGGDVISVKQVRARLGEICIDAAEVPTYSEIRMQIALDGRND